MLLRSIERLFLCIGLILVCAYAGMRLYGDVASRTVIAVFSHASPGILPAHRGGDTGAETPGVDTSLWSDKRIHAYNAS